MKNTIKYREISLAGRTINYRVRPSRRYLRLRIKGGGELIVSKPRFVSLKIVEGYLRQKSKWILEKMDLYTGQPGPAQTRENYLRHKKTAREFIRKKLDEFNLFYRLGYNRLSIKNQSTCWGSCSKKGNLNFNWQLINLPEPLADLVIVHELCHLRHFNHSPEFWELVAQTIPDYRSRRRDLRNSSRLISR